MTEKEYLDALNKALKWLPKSEKDLCFDYAREMIEDRIENGLSESEAVAQLETPQQLAKAFLEDRGSLKFKFSLPLNNVSTLILLILGFPLWGTLLLAGLMILLAGFLIAGCVPFVCVVMTVSLLFVALVSISASPLVMASVSLGVGILQCGIGVIALGGLLLTALGASVTIPLFKTLVINTTQFLRSLFFQEVKKW
ncbi:HAAS signaling domain-containing protein [Holdemania massiliensis]|uniref:HAAS signaling domain-containing protein n=1 Tax=Holdemania massiliensis TaxID=1468449 RepID=UPI001F0706B0|nr:DUF1700 domain-containing protein [Holdemania massiliensis]MCH1941504.1 DUF1700 domain-containing protein [Holdemania massiliensis]